MEDKRKILGVKGTKSSEPQKATVHPISEFTIVA